MSTEHEETTAETPQSEDEDVQTTGTPEPDEKGVTNDDTPDEAETFPRDYVVKLREENAKYRQRAADRDQIAERLHTALVAATGRLQDATDLPFDDDHIDDPDKMVAAIDALLAAKPHLASRKPAGNIGQGVSGVTDTFTIAGALRTNAS